MDRKSIYLANSIYNSILSKGVSHVVMPIRLSSYNFSDKPMIGEKEWVRKWKVLGIPNKKFYRLYSQFIGPDINIVPDDIMSNIIEPILNPVRYRSLYEDKNMLDKFFSPQFDTPITPHNLIRNIDNILYDFLYEEINKQVANNIVNNSSAKHLISKASIDENSGRGIYFWKKRGSSYVNTHTNETLSVDILRKLYPNGNYILQEVAQQSDWMSQFCSTAVNTLRIHMYRSVTDNSIHLINAVMRIGREGSFLDNAHAGGIFCGINPNGSLQDFILDQHANKMCQFNKIDFSNNEFVVPNWNQVKEFCKKVMACIPHMRNLALDVMLDSDNNPKLIEYNTDKFSLFFYQLTNSTVFEAFTDEVISYCQANRNKATRIFVTF